MVDGGGDTAADGPGFAPFRWRSGWGHPPATRRLCLPVLACRCCGGAFVPSVEPDDRTCPRCRRARVEAGLAPQVPA